jgi:hypothetical protein
MNTNLQAKLKLSESDYIKDNIAILVDNILHEKSIKDSVGLSKVAFGYDSSDFIDSFSLINFKLPLNHIVKSAEKAIKSLIADIISGNVQIPFGLNITKAILDIIERNTFSVDFESLLKGLPHNVTVNIPFVHVTTSIDGRNMLDSILNVHLSNSSLSSLMKIPFVDDKVNGQKLIQFARNIVWHQKGLLDYKIDIHSLSFGSSRESAFKIASKVKLPAPFVFILMMIKSNFDGGRPLELTNIPAIVNNRGIIGRVYAKPLPMSFPLQFKAPEFNCSVLYQVKGQGIMNHALQALFDNVDISPGLPIYMGFGLIPDPNPNGFFESIDEAILFLLNGTDYAQNARLGWVTIRGVNGAVFDIMSEAYMVFFFLANTFSKRLIYTFGNQLH